MAHLIDYEIDVVKNSWVIVATSGAAAVATATKAAEVGRMHIVVKVDASYDTSTDSGLLEVKYASTVKGRKDIHGAGALDYGLLGLQEDTALNQAVTATLAAGTAIGHITMTGYSTGPNA